MSSSTRLLNFFPSFPTFRHEFTFEFEDKVKDTLDIYSFIQIHTYNIHNYYFIQSL